MRAQLKHLIDMSPSGRTSRIQVIPFKAGGHAAAGGPFSILRFAEYDLPDVVYLEQLTSALYLDKQEIVDALPGRHGAAVPGGLPRLRHGQGHQRHPGRPLAPRPPLANLAFGGREREPDLEAGVAGLGLHLDVAVVPVHDDPPADVQAEAGALADALGGEERLEDPVPDLGRDAGPGVADLDQHAVPVASRAVRTVSVPVPSIASTALSMRFVHTWLSSAG